MRNGLIGLSIGVALTLFAAEIALADPVGVRARGRTGWRDHLIDGGPSADRLDVVLVAEGYTVDEQDKFRAACARASAGLLSAEPWSTYRGLVNIHAVFLPAATSGVTNKRTTVYETQSATPWEIIEGDDGLVERVVNEVLPDDADADAIVVLVNDADARSVSSGTVVYVAENQTMHTTIVHELGHGLADLDDEYTELEASGLEYFRQRLQVNWIYPSPNLVYLGKPKRVRWESWDDPSDIPWSSWIKPDTMVPCRKERPGVVGLFEGGRRYSENIYRPCLECCMRINSDPFCPPCLEAMVHAIYAHSSPTVFEDLRVVTQGLELTVDTKVPSAKVTWRWGGAQPAPKVRGRRSGTRHQALLPASARVGGRVHVTVRDQTPWVRKGQERLVWEHTYVLDQEPGSRENHEGIIEFLRRW